jgi:hypothetical protein
MPIGICTQYLEICEEISNIGYNSMRDFQYVDFFLILSLTSLHNSKLKLYSI